MRWSVYKLLIAILTALLIPVVNAAGLPLALVGKWKVIEVHVDTASGRTMHYGWNDPRLRWRIFTFNNKEISHNSPEQGRCAAPTTSGERVHLDDFLSMNLGGYGKGSSRSPSKDFGLGLPGNREIEVMRVLCGQERWNPALGAVYDEGDSGDYGSWLLIMSGNRVMLRWYDETILVLKKIEPQAEPVPTFACAKAVLPTERTICGSFELAGLDKSVDFSYRLALREARQIPVDAIEIRRRQSAWLGERNRCGSDANCIQVAMKRQLEWYASKSF
ncbi:PF07007 family protein [Burkholderia aenigmatica]|uniref:PF07007 family protein n=2 Tax=Burkholderiaceae TaxID=119060 RepID=A0A6J5JUJ9_9BURK|nr:PF07007 family protein [Burkholderia aenigmatica]VWC76379.1 PF07007 family protein [Burkholderia aenigmatica]